MVWKPAPNGIEEDGIAFENDLLTEVFATQFDDNGKAVNPRNFQHQELDQHLMGCEWDEA